MKIRVHINTDMVYMDDEVYIDIDVPMVPRVGEILFLKEAHQEKLEEQAKKSVRTIKRYKDHLCVHAIDKIRKGEELTIEDAEDLSFEDCFLVVGIKTGWCKISEKYLVSLELGK